VSPDEPPLESPWQDAYPFRDDLWVALRRLETHPGKDAIARGQISAAYAVEGLAREFMAGRQFTGILLTRRHAVVDNASRARDVRALWSAGAPGTEAQAFIDRAAGCLRQAFDATMHVYQWDRPGYDDITGEFRDLLQFASEGAGTPVLLSFEEERTVPESEARADLAVSSAPASRRWPRPQRLPAAAVLVCGLLAVRPVAGMFVGRSSPPVAQPTCPEQAARVHAGLVQRGARGDPVARAALERLDAGDLAGADAVLSAAEYPDPVDGLLAVEMFLYRVNCPAGPPR